MHNKYKTIIVAIMVIMLGLTGCSKKQTELATTASTALDNIISVNGTEPQNPLIPGMTNEPGGGRIMGVVFSGLKYYDVNGKAINDLAQSIVTDDRQHYVVKIRDNAKFSDGSPVKAENFVKAWNLVVKDKQNLREFFTPIAGFPEKNEQVNELTGLKVVDDKTFTIDLKEPVNDFESRLGYTAFKPMSDAAFTDLKAYGQQPIGSGPYKVQPKSWLHNQGIVLVPNEYYEGPRKAKNGGVRFVFYAKISAAYADLLSGQLDLLDQIPTEQLTNYKADLKGRFVNKPVAITQYFAINVNKEHFKLDEEGRLRRHALSMAIDRKQITDVIFKGTSTPAREFTSPVVAGYRGGIPGNEVLDFNPEKAKQLWAQADKINKFNGKFYLAYDADRGYQFWIDAIVNQIKNNLGIAAEGDPYPDFKSMRGDEIKRTIKLASRKLWEADYPHVYNFLAPVFTSTRTGANLYDYNNPEFDRLIYASAVAKSEQEGAELLQKAQEILLQDLPSIPLWYQNCTGGYGGKLSNVQFSWDSAPLYYNIVKD